MNWNGKQKCRIHIWPFTNSILQSYNNSKLQVFAQQICPLRIKLGNLWLNYFNIIISYICTHKCIRAYFWYTDVLRSYDTCTGIKLTSILFQMSSSTLAAVTNNHTFWKAMSRPNLRFYASALRKTFNCLHQYEDFKLIQNHSNSVILQW